MFGFVVGYMVYGVFGIMVFYFIRLFFILLFDVVMVMMVMMGKLNVWFCGWFVLFLLVGLVGSIGICVGCSMSVWLVL